MLGRSVALVRLGGADPSVFHVRACEATLQILQFPHPTLRYQSKPLRRVDAWLHKAVREMFELMYAANGIGLAANQVDLPYRLFILNLESDPAAKDQEFVFVNPVLTNRKGSDEAEEGCLSLPGLYADVRRPEKVSLNAFSLSGEEVKLDLDGLFARAVQHELDHLDGVLFIDRLSPTVVLETRDRLADFIEEFARQREHGEVPDDEAILQRLHELEAERS